MSRLIIARGASGYGGYVLPTGDPRIAPTSASDPLGVIRLPGSGDGALGVIPAVVFTVLDAGAKLGDFFNSISSLFGSGKEPGRLAANQAAFMAAMNGNEGALLFLKQRTGDFGVTQVPGVPEPIGGWATESAQSDARQKYNTVLAAIQSGQVAPGGAVDPFPTVTGGFLPGGGGSTTGGGGLSLPPLATASLASSPVLWLGLGVGAVILLSSRRTARRR